jgi:hypothetical protein
MTSLGKDKKMRWSYLKAIPGNELEELRCSYLCYESGGKLRLLK